ncbi:MAG: hypothetical protein CM15mP93_00820 [Thiotrichaceae bacterium]|nr:MAG: hypothetical protein CM15mP93_00820 [Thiotrichaceae bacterium]
MKLKEVVLSLKSLLELSYWRKCKNRRCVDLAEEIFHKQVRIGIPQYVSGASDIVKNPVYSTAVGLLLIAKRHGDK